MTTTRWWQPVQWRWHPYGEDVETIVVPEDADVEPTVRQPRPLAALRLAVVWLTVLATLCAMYFARSLLMPILFAAFVSLCLNPLVSNLSNRFVPRAVVAALAMVASLATLALVVAWIADPAQQWFERAPEAIREFAPTMREMTQQIQAAGRATESIVGLGPPAAAHPPVATGIPALFNVWEAISATPRVLMSLFATLLLVYFFLVYGDALLRKVVVLSPSLTQKKNAVGIVRQIQHEMARYIFTTTVINSFVGLGAGLIAYALGIADPLLWAVLAAALNFIPYLGPLVMTLVFVMLGLITEQRLGAALTPAGLFALLVIIEGQFLTPMILGRRMELDPVVILLWLMLLGWLWGALGILIAVPALVTIKIICQRVQGWEWVAKVIG